MSLREKPFFETKPMFVYDHISKKIYDVNEIACEKYGFSRQEFQSKTFTDLGERQSLEDLVEVDETTDELVGPIWKHKDRNGDQFFIQFTETMFRYDGRMVKLATGHDVTGLINKKVDAYNKYPRLTSFTSKTPLAKIEWDINRHIISWSDGAEALFGWTEEEMLGEKDVLDVLFDTDGKKEEAGKLEQNIEGGMPGYTSECRNIAKSGNSLYCEWYNTLLYDEQGTLVTVQSLIHDVTERRESEHMFRALTEESLVGVYLIQDGVFKYVNPKFAQIFHYKTEEIENKLGPLDLTHPEDRNTVKTNIEKRIEGERKSIQYDFRCLTKDNQVIFVEVYGTRIDYMGKPAVIGTLVDITDNKLAMERFKASVESFEDLFDSISDGILIQDEQGKIMEVNRGTERIFGYEEKEFLGKQPDMLTAPGKVDKKMLSKYFNKALSGESQTFESWGVRENGEVFPKEVVLNPGKYFGEDVVIAIVRDITERFEAEEQLRKSEELFRQLFQNAPVGIAMLDKHQEIRFVNKSFEQTFGYSSDEAKGLDIDHLIVPEGYREEAENLSADIFSGEATGLISKRKCKDGTFVDVIIYGVPVVVESTTIAIFGIYVDITDRKRAEEQVRKSLKEKEVLLAEIHHRVKNNLAVITGLLELQAQNSESGNAREILKESQMRINSIALIHEKLYQSEDLSQISFDKYLNELIDIIVGSLIKDRKEVDLNINVDPLHLTVNQAIPCGLILNELITNSYKHAFPDDQTGEIKVDFRRNNGQICMSVRDNGVGIPDEMDLENPSTLGLTLINTLSRQLEGDYSLESNKKGTVFTLQFEADE